MRLPLLEFMHVDNFSVLFEASNISNFVLRRDHLMEICAQIHVVYLMNTCRHTLHIIILLYWLKF